MPCHHEANPSPPKKQKQKQKATTITQEHQLRIDVRLFGRTL